MSHYEERLQHDLDAIRAQVSALGRAVDQAVADAVKAVLRRDRALAARTILGDMPINRGTREVDRLCHAFVARHLPSAGILRYVSSVLRLMVAVERVGDYAVTVAREAVQLTDDVPMTVARDIEMLGDQSRRMLTQSMKAFEQGNAELARGTKGTASAVRSTFDKVFNDLLQEGESRPLRDLFATLIVLNRVQRISDQAKNICEETIFAATGETKRPKVYRVLFVDAGGDAAAVMAAAIAGKAFPESGAYATAGISPAVAGPDARVVAFMERNGHDVSGVEPQGLPATYDDLNDYHVIVGLAGDVAEHLSKIPFHTIVVSWDLPDAGNEADGLEKLYKRLAGEVRELMETLRGENAG